MLPPPAQPAGNLGAQAFRGVAWTLGASFGTKITSLLGQIFVAKVLLPHDLGAVGLAYTVTAFTTLLQKNGLREILVQRGEQFPRLANAAGWLSGMTGLAVALLTAAAGPLAARIYGAPELAGVLVVLALGAPFQALQAVPGARLQLAMRFPALSAIAIGESLGLTGLTLLFAVQGWGAYAIVAPYPIVQALSVAWQWRVSDVRLGWDPEPKLWRELFGASSLMLGAAALYAFNANGASMVLGLFRDVATVGLFFFANNFSTQITGIVTANLWTVLLPSLGRLQADPARQTAAFKRVCDVVSLVSMPICFGLAAVAEPALRLLYGEKWLAAVPALQFLSVGAAFGVPFALAINLMMAQGRYRALFLLNVYRSVGFLALIGLGGWWGGGTAVAAAAALYNLLYGPPTTLAAVQPGGGRWREVWALHVRPLVLSVLGVGVAAALGALPLFRQRPLLQLTVTVLAGVAFCALLARWIMPVAWEELAGRVRSLLPGRPVPA